MLINKTGFKSFNEYDLQATLDAKLEALNIEIKNQDYNIENIVTENQIQPLEFKIDQLHVTKEQQLIPSEYFPSGYLVHAGESYPKDVLTFHLPFSGDQYLLHSVPNTRIIWTEDIKVENSEIIFDIIKFNDDAEVIKGDRDRIINYLVGQSTHINNQIKEFNNSLSGKINKIIENKSDEAKKNIEFFEKLGTPLKEDVNLQKSSLEEPRTSIKLDVKSKKYDAFISYASEDKLFVEKLAKALKKSGYEVWYDDFQVGWGDDLRSTIDNGLKNSRYGLVVFSKAFLEKKKWTEYELNGLFSREKKNEKVILPIWHNITRDDLLVYSPTLADRVAKKSDSISDIVKEFKKFINF